MNLKNIITIQSKKIETQWFNRKETEHPTLVFLHEGLGCVDMWKDFPFLLSERTGCPCVVFSRLGYGASDPKSWPWKINFMHDEGLHFLPLFLSHEKIKDHILIGHSDGGSIALIYAGSLNSLQLKGVITLAAHVFCEKLTVKSINKAKIDFEHNELRSKLLKYHGPNTENTFRGWSSVWLNPRFLYWNIEKYLKHINVPILAIQGDRDQYGTLKQVEAISNGARDVTPFIAQGCRHAPHLEQSDMIVSAVKKFMDRFFKSQSKKAAIQSDMRN